MENPKSTGNAQFYNQISIARTEIIKKDDEFIYPYAYMVLKFK